MMSLGRRSVLGAVSLVALLAGATGAVADDLDWVDITNNPGGGSSVLINLTGLDRALDGAGYADTLYGAIRLDDTYPTGLPLTIGSGLLGAAAEVDAAIAGQTGWSGTGDGFAAIQTALDTYGDAFRAEAYQIIAFGSAETAFGGDPSNVARVVHDASVTEASLSQGLHDAGARLFAFIDQPMMIGTDRVLAIVRAEGDTAYTIARIRDGRVAFETVDDIAGLFPDGTTDYTDLALDSYGAIMDRSAALELEAGAENPLPAITGAMLSNMRVSEPQAAEEDLEASATVNNRVSVRQLVSILGGRAATLARQAQGGGFGPAPGTESGGEDEEARRAAGLRTGLAGGDGATEAWYAGRLGLWIDASGTLHNGEDAFGDFDGHQISIIGGADYRVSDSVLVGAGLGHEVVTVKFDNGRRRDVGYLFTTAYGAYLLTDTVSLNALASYGLGMNTTTEAAALVGDGEHDHLSHRFIGSASVAYNTVHNERVTLFGHTGASYSLESFEDYDTGAGARVSADAAELMQLHAHGEVGYLLDAPDEAILEPFVSARLEYDVVNSAGGDRFGALLGGGLRAQVAERVSLEVRGDTEVGRSDAGSTSFGLNMRLQF